MILTNIEWSFITWQALSRQPSLLCLVWASWFPREVGTMTISVASGTTEAQRGWGVQSRVHGRLSTKQGSQSPAAMGKASVPWTTVMSAYAPGSSHVPYAAEHRCLIWVPLDRFSGGLGTPWKYAQYFFWGGGYNSNNHILSRGFAASTIWEIHKNFVSDFQDKGRVWVPDKSASLERYASSLMDSETAKPMDHHRLNLINCPAALDFQGFLNKGHDAHLLKS